MARRSHGDRVAEGTRLTEAAAQANTKPITDRWNRFKKAHAAYSSLHAKADKAEAPLTAQQINLAEADADQDAAVERLAAALVGDGQSRTNPFKAFGAPAPSTLVNLGYEKEAKACLALVRAVRKRKDLGKATTASAAALEKAAKAVIAAGAGMGKHAKPLAEARAARDAAALHWETAYAGLKIAARYAEDGGAKGLYAALFGGAPKAAKKAKKKAAAPVSGGGGDAGGGGGGGPVTG